LTRRAKLIKKLRKLLDARELSVLELTNAYLDRIDKYNGALNAFIYVNRDGAKKAAAGAQAMIGAGEQSMLTGIPIALADNIFTDDMPATCASYMLDGYRPPYDATVAERLRAQGAVFLGKLNIDEFSVGATTRTSYYGCTVNPYCLAQATGNPGVGLSAHTPAGKGADGNNAQVSNPANQVVTNDPANQVVTNDPVNQVVTNDPANQVATDDPSNSPVSGAAAAVAAGLCAAAVGVDSGGSACLPAAFCGVKGFRPSFGMVSRHGCAAYASGYDQATPVAVSSEDCAIVMEAILGYCPKDLMTSVVRDKLEVDGVPEIPMNINGLRVGVIRELICGEDAPEVKNAVDNAIKWFGQAGADVSEINIPMLKHGGAAYHVIACAEASANLARLDGVRYGRRADVGGDAAGDYFEMVSRSRGEGFGREVKRQILFGTCMLSQGYYEKYYKRAVAVANMIKTQYCEALLKYDLLISPAGFVSASPNGNIGASSAGFVSASQNGFIGVSPYGFIGASFAGLPSATTPCGYMSSSGLPIGLTLTGRRFDDMRVLGAAAAFEKGFGLITPEIYASPFA